MESQISKQHRTRYNYQQEDNNNNNEYDDAANIADRSETNEHLSLAWTVDWAHSNSAPTLIPFQGTGSRHNDKPITPCVRYRYQGWHRVRG